MQIQTQLDILLILCDLVSTPIFTAVAFKHEHNITTVHDVLKSDLGDFDLSNSILDAAMTNVIRGLVVLSVLSVCRQSFFIGQVPVMTTSFGSIVYLVVKMTQFKFNFHDNGDSCRGALLIVGLIGGIGHLISATRRGQRSWETRRATKSQQRDGDMLTASLVSANEGEEVKNDGDSNSPQSKRKKRVYHSASRILSMAAPERPLLLAGVIALLFSSGSQMYVPYVLGHLINVVGDGTMADLNSAVYQMLVAFVVGALGSCARGIAFTLAGERLVARIRKLLFRSLVSQEIGFFDSVQSGELVNRLSADTTVIQDIATVNVSMGLRFLMQVLIGLVVLFVLSWHLTLVMLGAVPPVILMAMVYGGYTRKISKKYQKALADAGEVAGEVLSSMKTVRSIPRGEAKEQVRYGKSVSQSYHYGKLRAFAYGGWSGFILLFSYLAIVLVLWYGGREVLKGHLDPGFLTSFLLYTLYIAFALGGLADLFTKFMTAVGASERMFDLLDRKGKINVEGGEIPETIEGHVILENVKFSYPSREDIQVLNEVSLECRPSEVVAVVGRSGAGKSTIVSLLERFYDVDAGRITIDGRDIRTLDPRWLHSKVALVAQEPVLFACSIRDNIAYASESATHDQIEAAAKLSNAHEFIMNFPEGYDTLVGERGVKLSGGQKQRVAIARAVLTDPKILLLDEATSALDAESEHLVQAAIDKLMKNRTVVVVAHRLSTVKNASQVIVLDGSGSIVQRGTHEELVKDEQGLYHQLVRRQLQS